MRDIAPILIAALASAWSWAWLWHTPVWARWRASLTEAGETSLSLVILAVSLVVSITVLALQERTIPSVLSQSLAGVLMGVAGGEIRLRQVAASQGKPAPADPPPRRQL